MEIMKNAWKSGRLGQAFFFHGPDGIGKRTFAKEMGRALLCEKTGPELEACDACPSCALVESDNHPDLHYAAPPADSLEFPIELMRQQCEQFALKSFRGGYRILILDDCDKLNEESANCFLKRLEEPPPKYAIFLLGSSPEKQLETILSRCQQVAFTALTDAQVKTLLGKVELPAGANLEKTAEFALGSPGLAMRVAQPEFLQARETFLQALGEKSPDAVRLAKLAVEFSESAGKNTAEQRARVIWLFHTLVHFLRNSLKEQLLSEATGGAFSPPRIPAMIQACLSAEERIHRRMQISLVVESWVEELLWPANPAI